MSFSVKSPMVELSDIRGEMNGRDSVQSNLEDGDSAPNLNNTTTVMIFDSIALQFSISVFFYQLLANSIILFAPFITHTSAQGYSTNSKQEIMPLVYNILFPAFVYMMIISYFMMPEDNKIILSGALWMPLIYFIQHKLIVALKYASLSDTEYLRFMSCKDYSTTQIYQSQMQLIAAWLNRDENVLEFELGAAAARVGAKINDIWIFIQDPHHNSSTQSQFRNWNAFLRGQDIIDVDSKVPKEMKVCENGKDYHISVYDLCIGIIRKADKLYYGQGPAYNIIFVFSLLNLLIPIIKLIVWNNEVVQSYWLYVFMFCSSITNISFGIIVYNLLYVAIFDVVRQLNMVKDLNFMIRMSDLVLNTQVSVHNGGGMLAQKQAVAQFHIKAIMALNKNRSTATANGNSSRTTSVLTTLNAENLNKNSAEGRKLHNTNNDNSYAARIDISTLDDRASSAATGRDHGSRMRSETRESINTVRMSDMTSRFTALGEKFAKDNDIAVLPRISFDQYQNIVSWTYTRLVIQNFGSRFRFRIDIYVGGSITIMIILMVCALSRVISASDKEAEFHSCFLMQSVLAVTMVLGFMVTICYLSSLVNDELTLHSRTLAGHSLKIRNKMISLEKLPNNTEEIEKLEKISEFLETSIGVIDVNTDLCPFKIFGVPATSSLTMSIITTAVSFYGVLASLYSGGHDALAQNISNIG